MSEEVLHVRNVNCSLIWKRQKCVRRVVQCGCSGNNGFSEHQVRYKLLSLTLHCNRKTKAWHVRLHRGLLFNTVTLKARIVTWYIINKNTVKNLSVCHCLRSFLLLWALCDHMQLWLVASLQCCGLCEKKKVQHITQFLMQIFTFSHSDKTLIQNEKD